MTVHAQKIVTLAGVEPVKPVAFCRAKADEAGEIGSVRGQNRGVAMAVRAIMAGLALTGSAALADPAWLTPLPSIYEISVANLFASSIAGNCSAKFSMDMASIQRVEAQVEQAYLAAGRGTVVQERKLARADKAKAEAEIKRLIDAWHRDNQIDPSAWKPEVWCPQGEREMAKGSLVSQYLTAKRGT
jgi:hypothetical protein